MVREKKQQQCGKFFIVKQSRFIREYYLESGVSDVGTPNEAGYIYWTKYMNNAHGFKKLSVARKIADMLWAEHGVKTKIIDINGVIIK